MYFEKHFAVIMPHCAQGIGLYQESVFQIILNLQMLTINSLVSDVRGLNQHHLLNCIKLGFLLDSKNGYSSGVGVVETLTGIDKHGKYNPCLHDLPK